MKMSKDDFYLGERVARDLILSYIKSKDNPEYEELYRELAVRFGLPCTDFKESLHIQVNKCMDI